MDMIRDGNDPEFAAQVCASMAILYQANIESVLPKSIDVENTIYNQGDIDMRANATQRLTQIMAVNGADYEIIRNYFQGQQRSSWGEPSIMLKHFLLTQRQNPDEIEDRYYLGECNRADMERTYSQNILDPQKYAKSIIMYKAFTAIVLARVSADGINHKDFTCTLQRGVRRRELSSEYPTYSTIPRGERFSGMKNGIAESTSLGLPPTGFRTEDGKDLHEMIVPFSRIHAVYFMSPELCGDYPARPHVKSMYGVQHEIICDISNLSVIIKNTA